MGGIGADVAPPRGARGLKPVDFFDLQPAAGRAPTRGAWIETIQRPASARPPPVAPPRGARGLKLNAKVVHGFNRIGRAPTRGAWIETAPLTNACRPCWSRPHAGRVD